MPKSLTRSRKLRGNQNASKADPRADLCSFRCRRADKAAWMRAALEAYDRGELGDVAPRGILAAWMTSQCNQAAVTRQRGRAA